MNTDDWSAQERLDFKAKPKSVELFGSFEGPCALEDDEFPFEAISDAAEFESWRKEIYRPPYHIHKWWAQRLGTVFRAVVSGALMPSGTDIIDQMYKPVRIPGKIVFDPFMGSGTTIGEALKLGARAVGRDINPVAHFLVRNALAFHDRQEINREFASIEADVSSSIKKYYKTKLEDGSDADVLYYFWVKQVECPSCLDPVDLFSTRVFARHAYAKKYPLAQATCPSCGGVNAVRYDASDASCVHCLLDFNPQIGPASGQKATCDACDLTFSIAKTVRAGIEPPKHRLYAKLVLTEDGKKRYLPATQYDFDLFEKSRRDLAACDNPYPKVPIKPGKNTDQALGYNYRYWHQMFNDRQLLGLSILADRIREIESVTVRELFTCLFSGALEFNNMFASYKGEGTGAVRHMFAHHILKPERVPLEANLWGTPKSSGSFSTMYKGRIERALNYKDEPFEIKVERNGSVKKSTKAFGISESLNFEISESFSEFSEGKSLYLSCGDSGATDLPDKSVDAVITDPPFFDNVHYSQLADFFHIWQRHVLGEKGTRDLETTRSEFEVQNAEVGAFTDRLAAVWHECARVLVDDGLLVFTYHHSRPDGWSSVLRALMTAGFVISAAFPVKAEMSVATPKLQAKEPIDLDIVLVCRKLKFARLDEVVTQSVEAAFSKAKSQVRRLQVSGRRLSSNDIRIVFVAHLMSYFSTYSSLESAVNDLERSGKKIDNAVSEVKLEGYL